MKFELDYRRNLHSAGVKIVPEDPINTLTVEFRGPGARDAARDYLVSLEPTPDAEAVEDDPQTEEAAEAPSEEPRLSLDPDPETVN